MKWLALFLPFALTVGLLPAQEVVISEFLTDNAGVLEDEDGTASDWIEIHNPGPNALNLLDWALTDTPANPFKWRFPATLLPSGGFLVVFASEKDRTNAGARLHTNFKLDNNGEYLALVRPDGSIAHEFSPVYPEQKQNTSYGFGSASVAATLAPLDAPARALVPTNGALGSSWTQVAFDDSGWLAGTTGVGYDNNTAGVDYNPLVGLNVGAQMFNRNASVYVRVPFVITNGVDLVTLTLRLQYEDGIIIYLNGVEVARNNAPEGATFNATALAVRPDETALVFATLDLTAFKGALQPGTNLLAFHGLNQSTNSSDLLIRPELTATCRGAPTGLGYLARPTPGAANTVSYPSFVRDTRFSHDRGFYETNFSLVITCATAGATIYYTTNGSAPSPTNGSAYAAPIPVNRTTVVRAAAHAPDALPSDMDSQTYIFLRDVLAQPPSPPGFPATWGPVSADYAMDPRIVTNALYAGTISNDLQSLPVLSLVLDNADMFGPNGIYANSEAAGDAWERPTSVEYFDPSQPERRFHINAGVQILGSSQRTPSIKKHGFRVLFKTSYGLNKLTFPLYPGTRVQKFNNLSLFPGGHDGCAFNTDIPQRFTWPYGQATFARARWLFQSQLDTGQPGVHGDFVHLYINGLYWGHYRLNERPDASYAADYFGGENEEYDALKHASPIGSTGQPNQYEVISGTTNAWVEMYALASAGLAGDAQFQAIQQYLDIESFIDYLLVNLVPGNLDWPDKNWYGTRRRLPGAGFKFYCWDGEIILGLEDPNTDRTGVNGANTPGFIYSQLRANAEFRRMFGDHVQRHMFNGGAMTLEAMQARFAVITHDIERSIVPESARWGDVSFFHPPPNPVLYTRETHWRPECDRIMTEIIPLRWSVSLQQFRAAGLFPNLNAPLFNQHGGPVPAGFSLTLANPNPSGTVFFTLEGSDPRVYGSGAVAPAAQAYATPVTLNATTLVRARVKDGANWSALSEAVFYTPQDFTRLLITEIMYNPPAFGAVSGDEVEFLELKNAGTNTLDLSGLSFTAGITFTFANGTLLGPGQFLVLGRNRSQLQAKYPGLVVPGVYAGKLDNGGETLTLSHPLGGKVLSVTYNDAAPWPVTPDNFGFSIVPRQPNANPDPDNASSWRASSNIGGSPGADDPAPAITPVVINEVITASLPPDLDAIELLNPAATEVDIGGWFLTDDPNAPKKFRIPAETILPASGFRVFTEAHFNPTPGTNNSFSLSSRGESVYLFSGDGMTNLTGYSHGFSFGAAADNVTFGRYVISTGEEHFPAQTTPTLGADNAGPRVGPLVITEIHYHPDALGDEFVELKNITAEPVPLYDSVFLTNTWNLNGLGFLFPTNLVVGSNEFLLLVATSPADFRAKYTIPPNVQIVGPWGGILQDSGERLELQRPDAPDTNGLAYITVDEVRYNDKAPWPPAADGSGPSLQRKIPAAYGNDPINWEAATPTPGGNYAAGAPPLITAHPTNHTALAGQTVAFGAAATGTPPLSFQWRFNGSAIVDATNATLVLANVQAAQAGAYSVVVFNGSGSATSSNAMLTVLVPAVITRHPASTNVVQGSNALFSVAATSSTPIAYRWQFNGASLPGAASPTLVLTNVQPAQAGAYTAVVTDSVGSVTSQVATLTVIIPPAILVQPQGQIALQYATVTMSVVATGSPPLAYRWRRNGFSVIGQTNATLLLTNVQSANAGNYAVFITNPAVGSPGVGSATAVLTVLADNDRDGMADLWETQYGFNTNNAADALLDADGDRVKNRDEYIAGTNPTNALSCLKVDRIAAASGGVTLEFLAVSNRTYTVEFTDTLGPAAWQNLTHFSAVATNHLRTVTDPTAVTNRFYRVATPQQP